MFDKNLQEHLSRVLRFGLVGIFGTVLYAAVVAIAIVVLGVGTVTATSVGFAVVVLANYLLHYSFTFRSANAHRTAFVRFIITSVIGFFINFFTIYIGVVRLSLSYMMIQIAAICLVVVSNYLLSTVWVFRLPR